MKLISSILILAGVFALNDASSVSFAEQRMRVASDKMKLEALREIETRDSQSVRCTSDYVDGVTKATNLLNSEIDECTNAMTKAKQEAETEAKQMVAQLGDKTSGSCSALSECLNIENAADALVCLNAGALDGSRTLSGVATDADTANIQMRRKIDAAAGAEVVCRDDAYAKYNRESVRLETILTDCLKGKTPAPTPAPEPEPTPAPEPAPTPAPEPEPTPAPEPAPTPAPEPAPESRRANKFQRF